MTNVSRTNTYRLVVDYDRSLGAMISDGEFDHVNEYLTETRFPVEGDGVAETTVELVCLGRAASTDEVLRALELPGARLGRIAELLALAAAQPDLQRSFPIVALGSAARYPGIYRRIPFLWGSPRVRHLDLRWDERSWGENIHFLIARDG